ncbi:MAG: hypothetical protein OXU19_10060 [bacterium]|nr:hypothetical protein [bacterium]MDE0240238.1 hypothetical protein [bacterium]MDE0418368.1 hypothetical protein [bacterium]
MTDTLGYRSIIGVMTPAMNTVVQPELESLRPPGVTNQMQRFRLGGEKISEDLDAEATRLMDCNPAALAIGLTTDAGPGGVKKLQERCRGLASSLGIPVFNASSACHEALRRLDARRISIVTPFDAATNEVVTGNAVDAGFAVAAVAGTDAPSLPEICKTSPEDIEAAFLEVAASDCDAILQVGTALPVCHLVASLETLTGKPVVACNAALYWQTLRHLGITDPIDGFGQLLAQR